MKKILCLLLAFSLCSSVAFGVIGGVSVTAAEDYSAGDKIEFGAYPQSLVADSALISSLDGIEKNWLSYSYFSGSGSVGTASASDYAEYADFEYSGEKYRAVRFDSYRPRQTYKEASAKNSFVDDNGYGSGTVYYFKFEPVSWIILDPDSGLAVTEKIIDSQPYTNSMISDGYDVNSAAYWLDETKSAKANDYLNSSVYSFLNNEFFNAAFTADERSQISSVTIDNDSLNGEYQIYSSAQSTDRVYLLSYSDAESDDYGFSTSPASSDTRTAFGTDYAKAQGLQVDETGASPWWLRSAGNSSRNSAFVNYSGFIGNASVEYSDKGVRPACVITSILAQTDHTVSFDYCGGSVNETSRVVQFGEAVGELPDTQLDDYIFEGWFTSKSGGVKFASTDIVKSDITLFAHWSLCEHEYSVTDHLDSTCKVAGYDTFTCSACGKTYTEIIPMTDHRIVVDERVEPKCEETGLTEGSHCSVCGDVIVPQIEIPATGHSPVTDEAVEASCTVDGKTEGSHCSVCGAVITEQQVIPAPGHTEVIDEAVDPTCTESGLTQGSHCSVCGEVIVARQTVPAKGHTKVIDIPAVAPTCTESGNTESSHCSVCGDVISVYSVIPAKGHTDLNNDGICDECSEIYDRAKYEKYMAEKQAYEAAQKVSLKIKEPSVTSVNYGHTLVLHASYSGAIPEGYSLKWEFSGNGFETSGGGIKYNLRSASNGKGTATVKLVGPDGNTVKDSQGRDISASKEITSKAGFFQKIIYFFKKLFGMNMIIDG